MSDRVPELRFATPVSQAAGAPSPHCSKLVQLFQDIVAFNSRCLGHLEECPHLARAQDEIAGRVVVAPGHAHGRALEGTTSEITRTRTSTV